MRDQNRLRRTITVPLLLAALLASSTSYALTKWDLWVSGTRLRGANIYQRRVYPELDGRALGPGSVGPPYTQADFDRLFAMGANYVNISHPGLFTEKPPYKLDLKIQTNLDRLIRMIGNANMFAVISFRTGPGRSEFTFFHDEAGTWFDRSYLNDSVWRKQAAQNAWAAMWKYTASRYRNNPVIAGYDLMVEPNANDVWLNLYNPAQFYSRYSGTLYDWNRFFPRVIQALRAVDANTPILVGGMSYSPVSWLPYITPSPDQRTIYTVHQYEPFEYTTQAPPLEITYPGMVDLNFDGIPDPFNRDWMNRYFSIIDKFKQIHHAHVASNEYGVMRWEPGAARFINDEMSLFEQRGMNYALWVWSGSWPGIVDFDDFDFLHGPHPENHKDVSTSQLIVTIKNFWKQNQLRPSNVHFSDLTGPAVPLGSGAIRTTKPPASAHSHFPMPHTRLR